MRSEVSNWSPRPKRAHRKVRRPVAEASELRKRNDRKALTDATGGWRQNGRKGSAGKQGSPFRDKRGVHAERCKIRDEAEEPDGMELRASVVAMKRVTTVEPRDAGK